MSLIELENPTKLTNLDCDAKTKDTLETVLSITKAEEIMHELKRAIDETQDHSYRYPLLILGDPFSIRFIIEPDIKISEKIYAIDQKKAVLPNQDDTPIFELEYPEYYYPTEFDEEEDEVQKLMVDVFWSYVRAHLYNEIHKGRGGFTQWSFITGKKSMDRCGARIQLTKKNSRLLWDTVNYFNTDEGKEELLKIGVIEPPEHIDDLISIISDSKTREETKAEEFRMFLKNRERILKFLSKI